MSLEVHYLPAPSEHERRLMWATYVTTVRKLLRWGVLGTDALQLIRQDLRVGDWRAQLVPASHRGQHVELLHDVTEAWAQTLDVAIRLYLEGVGDLLPSAPDTIEGLEP